MKLGRVNVDALGRSLTAKQFVGWEAYAQLEPFSELRADYRTASIVQMLANVNRGKGQKAFTLKDMLLRFEEKEQQDEGDMRERHLTVIRAIVAAHSVKGIDE